jgi:hypothetical protein
MLTPIQTSSTLKSSRKFIEMLPATRTNSQCLVTGTFWRQMTPQQGPIHKLQKWFVVEMFGKHPTVLYIWLYILWLYIYNYAYIHTLYHHIPHSNGNFKGYPPFSDKTMYGNIPEFLTYSLCWKSQIWQLSIARIHNWFELQSLLCRSAKHQGTKRTFWHFATENCDELVIENLLICRIQWSKDNQGIWFLHVGFSSPSHIRQVGYLKILR